MSLNWMRHFELIMTGNDGKGISLSDFKATFEIEQNDIKWPALATVKVYNLSTGTQNRIMQREFSKMKIIAGYDGIAPDVKASEVGVAQEIAQQQKSSIVRSFAMLKYEFCSLFNTLPVYPRGPKAARKNGTQNGTQK